jgi:hypothetical protein
MKTVAVCVYSFALLLGAFLTGSGCTEPGLHNAYDAGLVGKGEAMALDSMIKNRQPQNLYGKVIDQYCQPVAGVDVEGDVEIMNGWIVGKIEKHITKTDASGLFQFTGLRGYQLDAEVAKGEYEIDYRGGRVKPPDPSTPTNRVIFTMWKLRGPEPMVHLKLHSYIPCDRTVTRFDLLTGKKNPNGDLSVSLTRNPLIIDRKKPFDWTLTLQITNGGFQAITNIYPNEAPVDGYQSSMVFHCDAVTTNWTSQIQPKLYFKGEKRPVLWPNDFEGDDGFSTAPNLV